MAEKMKKILIAKKAEQGNKVERSVATKAALLVMPVTKIHSHALNTIPYLFSESFLFINS